MKNRSRHEIPRYGRGCPKDERCKGGKKMSMGWDDQWIVIVRVKVNNR